MPENDRPTTDVHQSRLDKRLTELEYMLQQANSEGCSFGQILKYFTHRNTGDGEQYSVTERTLYNYLEREEKMGNVDYRNGKWYWCFQKLEFE